MGPFDDSMPNAREGSTYSFEYGNAHFVIINQYYATDEVSSTACVYDGWYEWLVENLAQNQQPLVFDAPEIARPRQSSTPQAQPPIPIPILPPAPSTATNCRLWTHPATRRKQPRPLPQPPVMPMMPTPGTEMAAGAVVSLGPHLKRMAPCQAHQESNLRPVVRFELGT